MKKEFVILLMIVLFVGIVIAAQDTQRVIIKYKDKPIEKTGIFKIFSNSNIPEISKDKIDYKFKNVEYATLTLKEINKLKSNSNVEVIPVPTKSIIMDDSIYLTNSTNVWSKKIKSINLTGKDETICIIDTGINLTHPDLGNCYGNNNQSSNCKVLGGWDYCADDSTCSSEDSIPNDVNGHGTHVAGISAANGILKGIAPDAKLIIIKVFNSTGVTSDTQILKGMDWCINNATKFNISTISMSLGNSYEHNSYCDNSDIAGIEYNPPYTEKINLAKSKNITVTIASGNDDYENGISSPACIENATRVGSITKLKTMSTFSNAGNFFVDLLLTYGESINSTMIQNPKGSILSLCGTLNSYCSLSGTSMSTPMAAGIITLLRQYKKLESNINLTTDYIEEILINSSTIYEDTPSGGNYSIINSLAAILYSDEQAPNITSMLPINSSRLSQNQSFSCNVTDLQLSNLTIKLYNSTNLIKTQTTSNNLLTLYYDTTNNEYNWTCESIDNNSNSVSKINTLSVSSLFINIDKINNTYTTQNETSLNCSSTTSKELSNITFNIYNSTQLLNSASANITGQSNYSIFNYTLLNEELYLYNCLAINNESQLSQTQNYTLTYDITSPQIILTSPIDNTNTTTKSHTFTFNETEINKDSCNLTINNINYSSLTQTLNDGTYNWNITCSDLAGNTNVSETFKLDIYTVPIPPSGGGGGGGGSSTKIYKPNEKELEQGYTKKLKTKDIIKFKSNSNDHKLTLNEVKGNTAIVTIESNPITVTLYPNSPQKINLNDDKIFDIELTLTSIIGKYANIKIKEINETIPQKKIFEKPIEINETENKTDSKTEELSKEKRNLANKIIEIFRFIINFFKRIF